jgi:hypothetical protein
MNANQELPAQLRENFGFEIQTPPALASVAFIDFILEARGMLRLQRHEDVVTRSTFAFSRNELLLYLPGRYDLDQTETSVCALLAMNGARPLIWKHILHGTPYAILCFLNKTGRWPMTTKIFLCEEEVEIRLAPLDEATTYRVSRANKYRFTVDDLSGGAHSWALHWRISLEHPKIDQPRFLKE